MNKVSSKQSKSNIEVRRAKKEALERHNENHDEYCCSSCGTNQGRIDMSHAIPISSDKSLEAVSELIFPQCRKCHYITERGLPAMTKFNNYEEIMAAIKKHKPDFWRKLMVKHGLL